MTIKIWLSGRHPYHWHTQGGEFRQQGIDMRTRVGSESVCLVQHQHRPGGHQFGGDQVAVRRVVDVHARERVEDTVAQPLESK